MTCNLPFVWAVRLLLVLTTFTTTLAQELPDIEINSSDLVTVPNSPEVSAFIEYGNNTVSMYTGLPDISIPLHVVKGRKLTLPISLTYNPGIKVDQIASNVGIGWNLNAGGSVVRNVVGLVDDYNIGSHSVYYSDERLINGKKLNDQFEYFRENNIQDNVSFPAAIVDEYLTYRRKALDGLLDTQPDSYSFNINGLSGTLYIDYENNKGYCLEHPDLKVRLLFGAEHSNGVKPLIGWVLTDKLGTSYRFFDVESTHTFDDASVNINNLDYNSAWKISSICTYDNTDCIFFEYGIPAEYQTLQPIQGAIMRRDGPNDDGSSKQCPDGFTQFGSASYFKITKGFLKSISVNNRTEVLIGYETTERADLRGTFAIKKLNIYNSEGQKINKIKLNTDYFGDPGSIHEFDSRLMLTGVEIAGKSDEIPDRFTFKYFGPELPSRGSFAQDYWGYYNGMSNPSLIPYNPNYTIFTKGANRNVSAGHYLAGTLKSVQYPTGGVTEYTYEQPFINMPPQMVEVIMGNWQLTGGNDPGNAIGYCDDVAADPKGITGQLVIPREGPPGELLDVKIEVEVSGNGDPNPVQYIAFYDETHLNTHCDVYEKQNFLFYRHDNITDEVVNVQITPGTYRYMIMSDQPGVTIKLTISKFELQDSPPKIVGSLRLNKIENLDYDKTLLGQRYFYYGDLSTVEPSQITSSYLSSGPVTSGILHMPAIYETLYQAEQFSDKTYFDCEFLNRFSSNQATATPHIITYSTVTEVQFDELNERYNGFTVHRFHNKNESMGTDPYKKVHLLNGRLIDKEIYRYDPVADKNEILQKEEKEYEFSYLSNRSLGMKFKGNNDADFIDMSVWRDADDHSQHYYKYTATPVTGFKGGSYPTKCATMLSDPDFVKCLISTGGSLGDPSTGPEEIYTQYNTGLSAYWIRDISTTTTVYDDLEPSIELTNTLVNSYSDPSSHFQPEGVSIVDNKGNTIEVKNSYPHDVGNQVAAMNALIAQNRIGEVVETSRFYDNSTVPQVKKSTSYGLFGTSKSYRPSEIKLIHGSGDVQSIKIVDYDKHGNIQEIIDKTGIRHTYVWGYSGENLIAQIVGASYDEILGVLGNPLVPDEDNKNALSSAQHNLLRDQLKQAMVTSYVYDDGVGLTTMRDPNGKETHYLFDGHNRLEYVKEFGDQIMAYEYNTRAEEGRVLKLGGVIDFGKVEINATANTKLTLTNVGSEPLSVSELQHSNSRFSGTWSGTIQSGKSINVDITLNAPSQGTSLKNGITVVSNKTKGDDHVFATALIVDRKIDLDGPIDFGNQSIGTSGSRTLTIRNTGNEVLTISDITHSNGQFSGSWAGIINPGASQEVEISYLPTSPGVHNGTLTVNSDKSSGHNIVSLSGRGTTRAIALSGGLNFGNQVVNVSKSKTLTITNSDYEDIIITGITHSHSDFSADWSGTLAAGASVDVAVTFLPKSGGSKENTITVVSNALSGVNTKTATGFGVTRVLELAGTFEFGNVDVNSTKSLDLTISNSGNWPLKIIEIKHSHASYSGNWSGEIPAGDSRIVTINFSPTSEGIQNNTIRVVTNKTSGQNTKSARGNGVSRIVRLGGKKSWDDVDIHTTVKNDFTIFNDGNITLHVDSIVHGHPDFVGNWSGDIAPGSYHQFKVSLTPGESGDITNLVTVYTDKTSGNHKRTLRAFGVSRTIELSGPLTFGNRDINSSKTGKLNIKNNGNRDLEITGITHSNPDFSGDYSGTIAPGTGVLVPIEFKPTYAGEANSTITVSSNKTDGDNTTTATGFVITRVLHISATKLDFGNVDRLKTKNLKQTIYNHGNSPLQIDSITHSNSNFSGTWSGTIPAGGSQDMTVKFRPTSGGTHNNSMHFYSNRTSGSYTRGATGFGVTRTTSLGGTTNWGDLDLNRTRTKVLKITNTGNTTLTINGISHSNSDFTGNWTGTIAPGTYKNITIKLTPTVAGNITNKIVVDSDRTNGSYVRNLKAFIVTRTIKLPDGLTFENVDVGTSKTLKLNIRNDGNRTLTVTGITHSNSDFSGDWSGTIEPGAGILAAIEFKPTIDGNQSNTITVNSDKTNGTHTTTASGFVTSRIISMSTSTLNFGEIDIKKTVNKTLNIKNTGNTTLTINSISHSNSQYTGSWTGTIAAGASKNITLSFKPTSGGTKSNTITVNSNRTGGKHTRLASGFGKTRTIALSGTTAFGNTDINKTTSKTLTIKNNGNRTLNVTGITHSSSKFSGTWSGNIAAGASRNVTIYFKPTSAGTVNNTITVNSNRTNGTYKRSVNGYGVTRTIALSGNMDFGSLDIKTSKSLKLNIKNTGNTTLTVSGITHSSSQYSGNWSGTIAPGAGVLVAISFKPTSGGTKSNTITVNSNRTNGTYKRSATGYGKTRTISMSSSSLAFGDVDYNKTVSKTLNIKNTGNTTLSVTKITHSHGNYSGSWSGTIAPGASQNVTIRFKPTSGGTKSNTMTVYTNRTGGTPTRPATGYGVTRTVSLSGSTSWGDVNINTSKTRTLTIKNTGNRTLTINNISHSNGNFSGSWSGTIAAGASKSVTLTFKPTVAGSRNGTLTVNSNRTNGTHTKSVSGYGATRIVSLSGSLDFGNRTINSSSTKTFTITNTGNRTLTVSSVSAPSHYSVNWTSGTIAAGTARTVTVTFRPTSAGTKSGNISVVANKTSGGKFVAVTGRGLTRTIRLSGSMSFGDVPVDNSKTSYTDKNLRVYNDGNTTLTVTGINLPSHYSCMSCSFNQSISAGSYKDFKIRFNPSSAGSKNGTISVNSNKTGGTNSKSITGYGATRILVLSPNSSINFGSVNYASGSVTRNIQIRNDGNRTMSVSSLSIPIHYSANWSGGTISAGSSKWVVITYNPSSTGTHSGTITVNTNQTSSNDKTVAVTGTGTTSSSGGGSGGGKGTINN